MTGILALFRSIGWRNLLLGILAIAVFVLIRRQFFPENPAKPRVVSLFEKVEYVRELRLVTHYSEELLEIGVQDALSRKKERQEEQAENALLLVGQLTAKSELANNYAGQVAANVANMAQRKRLLAERRDRLVKNFRQMDPGRRVSAKEVQKIIREHPNAFSDQLKHQVSLWAMSPNIDRQQRKMFEEEIETMALKESEERKKKHITTMQAIDLELKQIKDALDLAEDEERRAEKVARNTSKEAMEAQTRYEQDTVLLNELIFEIEYQEANPLPKLIAVVSTEVTALVDLEGMESDLDGELLTICGVPPARVDSNVRIKLSSDNRFLTAKNLTMFSTNKTEDEIEKGMYYHVYEEMKEALAEMEVEVISDAIERGILEEANEMGLEYLAQMGRSLGFSQVQVLESCDPQPDTPAIDTEAVADSILISTDDLIRKTDSLEFVNDSLGIEVMTDTSAVAE